MRATASRLVYSFFNLTIPEVSIFHNPSSQTSKTALSLLRSSLTSPYPPSKEPLRFNLSVQESYPTKDQLKTLVDSYRFLPSDAQKSELESEVEKRKWPVVVDWSGGNASVGSVEGVKEILDELSRREG